jgi:hypothetical protein
MRTWISLITCIFILTSNISRFVHVKIDMHIDRKHLTALLLPQHNIDKNNIAAYLIIRPQEHTMLKTTNIIRQFILLKSYYFQITFFSVALQSLKDPGRITQKRTTATRCSPAG